VGAAGGVPGGVLTDGAALGVPAALGGGEALSDTAALGDISVLTLVPPPQAASARASMAASIRASGFVNTCMCFMIVSRFR